MYIEIKSVNCQSFKEGEITNREFVKRRCHFTLLVDDLCACMCCRKLCVYF